MERSPSVDCSARGQLARTGDVRRAHDDEVLSNMNPEQLEGLAERAVAPCRQNDAESGTQRIVSRAGCACVFATPCVRDQSRDAAR